MELIKQREHHTLHSTNSVKYLTYSVVALCVAFGSVMPLKTSDEKVSIAKGVFITSMGLIFFASLTHSVQAGFSETRRGQLFQQTYRLLHSDVAEITNKIVSTVQAILSSIAGAIVCNSSCRRSFLRSSHFMSDTYAWFGAAYFIYDIWHMYRVYAYRIDDKILLLHASSSQSNENGKTIGDDNQLSRNGENNNSLPPINYTCKQAHTADFIRSHRGEFEQRLKGVPTRSINFFQFCWDQPVMIIHHLFLGSFGLLVIVYLRGNFGDCVFSFMFLMELSTPFVNMRGMLSMLGLKKSTAYVVNGVIMLTTFFMCRILMWPMLYIWYSRVANISIAQGILLLPTSCKIGTLILFLPQLYWFYLMVRGALKIFFPSEAKPTNLTKNR